MSVNQLRVDQPRPEIAGSEAVKAQVRYGAGRIHGQGRGEDRAAIACRSVGVLVRVVQLRQRRENSPVGWDVAGTGYVPMQDEQLVAKDRDFHVFGVW